MKHTERNQIYFLISDVLNRRPRESLHDAAVRYCRNGRSRIRKSVARAVLAMAGKRDEAAWEALADAADLVRPHLVHA